MPQPNTHAAKYVIADAAGEILFTGLCELNITVPIPPEDRPSARAAFLQVYLARAIRQSADTINAPRGKVVVTALLKL